jgi:N6-adenosine-specific RNA methylase IME4
MTQKSTTAGSAPAVVVGDANPSSDRLPQHQPNSKFSPNFVSGRSSLPPATAERASKLRKDVARLKQELSKATEPKHARFVEAGAEGLEAAMVRSGLYSIKEIAPVREIRIRARVSFGRLLDKLARGKTGPTIVSHAERQFKKGIRSKCLEIGVPEATAWRAIKLGKIDDATLDALFRVWHETEKVLVTFAIAWDAARYFWTKEKVKLDEARVLQLQPRVGRYRTLIIDPPWDYEWLSVGGASKPGYATMTHEELLKLDPAKLPEDECHLYLWTTNNFLLRAADLMRAWGFEPDYKTVITWIKTDRNGKPKIGLGTYFRNTTEHVLFGSRGGLGTRCKDIPTHFLAPVGRHSEKPEAFYEIVRRASYLPAGEAFQRKERKGFVGLYVDAPVVTAPAQPQGSSPNREPRRRRRTRQGCAA